MRSTKKGPTFICIGPQKTGTSWLYHNLKKHPKVLLFQNKETRYLWERAAFPNNNLFQRLFKLKHQHFIQLKQNIRTQFEYYLTNLHHINSSYIDGLIWDLKFYFLTHSDKWYLSLYSPPSDKITGDISPQYWWLKEEGVKSISDLLPDSKVIILLRNPIDRIWSHTKHIFIKGSKPSDHNNELTEEKIYDFFESQSKLNYVSLIDLWGKYFPQKNVHVNFFDKLAESPTDFYDDVCNFLGIESDELPKYAQKNLKRIVYRGLDIEFPEKYAVHLAKLNENNLLEMCQRYEIYPQRWAEKCNLLLTRANSIKI